MFLGNYFLVIICLLESGVFVEWYLYCFYKDFWGVDWIKVEIDFSGICFVLIFVDWLKLFCEIGFEVENY